MIVEDIERMDFDFFEWHSGEVFEEWNMLVDELNWAEWRQRLEREEEGMEGKKCCRVTNKLDARSNAFDGIENHEVCYLL